MITKHIDQSQSLGTEQKHASHRCGGCDEKCMIIPLHAKFNPWCTEEWPGIWDVGRVSGGVDDRKQGHH